VLKLAATPNCIQDLAGNSVSASALSATVDYTNVWCVASRACLRSPRALTCPPRLMCRCPSVMQPCADAPGARRVCADDGRQRAEQHADLQHGILCERHRLPVEARRVLRRLGLERRAKLPAKAMVRTTCLLPPTHPLMRSLALLCFSAALRWSTPRAARSPS
jgi:hypothetical protein